MRKWIGAVAFFLGIPLVWAAVAPLIKVENHEEIRKMFGLTPAYDNVRGLDKMKVAVFDNGFGGVTRATMKNYLPEDTQIIDWEDDPEALALDKDPHGRIMAQTLWAMTGLSNDGPEMFLVNARGTSNFHKAHNWAIREGVNIVLISMNFEGTGNFDGGGEINRLVNAMTAEGIIVVVAAGNYGGMVHNSPIQVNRSQHLVFQTKNGKQDFLELTSKVTDDPSDQRPPLKIVAIWNDYTERGDSGTDRDFDLYLTDDRGNVLAKREHKQVIKKTEKAEENEETYSPRESLEYSEPLVAGQKFRIIMKLKSQSRFNANTDRVRVVLIPGRGGYYDEQAQKDVPAIEFPDASGKEEIMVPADNPNAITVGATSPFSAKGPTMRPIQKPEIILPLAQVKFGQGKPPEIGTSVAAAMFAGMVALMKSSSPHLTRADILKLIPQSGLPAMQELSWQKAGEYYPQVMNDLGRALNGVSSKIFVSDGQLMVEVDRFPDNLKGYFRGVDWSRLRNPFEVFEFYLAARQLVTQDGRQANQTAIRGYSRAMQIGGNGSMASPPWSAQKEDPRSFVQIVMKQQESGEKQPIWYKTPTPEQVFKAQQ